MMGLMLHANAKQLIRMERYKDALEVLPMGELFLARAPFVLHLPGNVYVLIIKLTGIEFCWFAKDLAAEALCRNENDTQKALDDLTNPESNSAIQVSNNVNKPKLLLGEFWVSQPPCLPGRFPFEIQVL